MAKYFSILITDKDGWQSIACNGVVVAELHSMKVWPRKKRLENGTLRDVSITKDIPDYEGPRSTQEIGEYLKAIGDLMITQPPQPSNQNP